MHPQPDAGDGDAADEDSEEAQRDYNHQQIHVENTALKIGHRPSQAT
jgi:hypothetical protein